MNNLTDNNVIERQFANIYAEKNALHKHEYVLEVSGLKKSYIDVHSRIDVLHHIDLKVKRAELVAIVGTSGSGKSTLLHLLGGLDKPTEGKIAIAGQELSRLSENEKCRLRNNTLGFVYQFHHLLPEFTALENACMPLLMGQVSVKEAKERATHLLELVGLKERLTHKMSELSGGERQRVAIARALVSNPLCVLADEPTGNLDPQNADKVLQLFFNLQKTFQTSVIIVTHDRHIANQTNRTLSLAGGRLIES